MSFTTYQTSILDRNLEQYVEAKSWNLFLEELNKKENEGYEIKFSLLEKFLHRAVYNDQAAVVDKLLKMPALTSALSTALLESMEKRNGGRSQEAWLIMQYLCSLPNDKQPKNMDTTLKYAVWNTQIDLIRVICSGTKRNLTKNGTSDAILQIEKANYDKYKPEQKADALQILTAMTEPQNRPNKGAMNVALGSAIRGDNAKLVKAILNGSSDLDDEAIGNNLNDVLGKSPTKWDMIEAFLGSNRVGYKQLKRIDQQAQDAKKSEISTAIKESIKKLPTADLQTVLDEQVDTMILMSEWTKISALLEERSDYNPKPALIKKLGQNFYAISASALSLIRYLVKEENSSCLPANEVSKKLQYLISFLGSASAEEKEWIGILIHMTGPNAPNEKDMTDLFDKVIRAPYINLLTEIVNLTNSRLKKEHVKQQLDELSQSSVFYVGTDKQQIKELLNKLLTKMPEPKTESKPKSESTGVTITSTQVPSPKQQVVIKIASTSKSSPTQPLFVQPATSAEKAERDDALDMLQQPSKKAAKETTSFTQPAPSAPKDELAKWTEATKLGQLNIIQDMIKNSPKISTKETTALLYNLMSDAYPQNRWAIMHILIKLSAGNKPEDGALTTALTKIITNSQVGLLKDFPFNRLKIVNIPALINDLNYMIPSPTKEREEIKTILEAFNASINPSSAAVKTLTTTAIQSNPLSGDLTQTKTQPRFISDENPSNEGININTKPAIDHKGSSNTKTAQTTSNSSMNSTTQEPDLSPRKKECTETLDKILLELRNKIKDISPSYNSKILKQAQALCLALETSKKNYVAHLTNQDETIEKASKQFSAECSSSINNAKKAWGDKLGWGDSLINLLKSILNALIKIFSSNPNRLFTPVKAAGSLNPIFEQAKGAIDLDLQTRGAITP